MSMIKTLLIAAPKLDCHKHLYILQFLIYWTVSNTYVALHSNYPPGTEQDSFSLTQLHLSTKISVRDLHFTGEKHLEVSNRYVKHAKVTWKASRAQHGSVILHVHHF